MPPALSETSITGGPSSAWNSSTTAPRSRVEPSRRVKAMPASRRCGSTRSSSDVHCENTSALCPSAAASSSASSRRTILDEVAARLPGNERRVARRLAQTEQRLERREHAPAGLELGDDLFAAWPRARRRRRCARLHRARNRAPRRCAAAARAPRRASCGAARRGGSGRAVARRRRGLPAGDGRRVALLEIAARRRAGRGW